MSELALAAGSRGFRLESMELYNWGTFGRSVWAFPFGGENALVTGDIGSGKSTWVDALTALLVPPQRITYNKAAGAERRERTDRSYLLGEYRSSRADGAFYSKPVTLRDERCYSVLIAVFADQSASRLISLAQVRWIKAAEVQRIYVVSGRRLSVLADFGDFDGDGAAFRRRLRGTSATEVFESYADYAASFRAAMGVGEKALDLFNQTLSMKTIGDLDDFIRDHMLEPPPARERLDRILRNFDNLRVAHDAVESSRRQRDALLPIDRDASEHEELAASIEELRAMSQSLPFRAIALGIPLLERQMETLRVELEGERGKLNLLRAERASKEETRASLRSAIDNSEAGRRIREIEAELGRIAEERDRRRAAADRLRDPLARLGQPFPASAESFSALRAALEAEQGRMAGESERLGEERDERLVERNRARDEAAAAEVELDSLRRRTTSIPAQEIRLRREIAEAAGCEESELPFAGELIRVRPEERKWEGAAERILRSFALSVLVPENRYRAVSEYVRRTRLGARLVARCEPDYPPALAAIDDAPPLLTVKGRTELATRRAVAVVGARNASANGRRFAREIATHLGAAGLLVVSGLARGIDAAAHEGSLDSGTLAVLAGGIDAVYPEENRRLHETIAEHGLLVAEMPVGTVPQARHFPRRNRIISGIALGVLVVEAAERSGSLITARFALEQGREVFAVPGSPLDPRCKGTNRLIRDGATLVEAADDILREISPQLDARLAERQRTAFAPAPTAEIGPKDLADAREIVLGLLSPTPLPVDELLRQCQMSPAVILTIVLELELAGRVARQPGNALTLI